MEKKNITLPHTLKLSIFLFILCVICAGLLALVNSITKDKIAENNRLEEIKANETIINKLTDYGYLNVTLSTDEYDTIYSQNDGRIVAIYEGENSSNKIYSFKVECTNSYLTFNTLVVIEEDESSYYIRKVEVLDDATTLGKGVNDNFYGSDSFGVMDNLITNYSSNVTFISGATYSSKTVKKAISYAIEQLKLMKGLN